MSQINMTIGDKINLTSPNFPLEYYNDIFCAWSLYATSDTDEAPLVGRFLVRFLHFHLPPVWASFDDDHLVIETGDDNGQPSVVYDFKRFAPNTLTILGSTVEIWFAADHRLNFPGFLLQVQRTAHDDMSKVKNNCSFMFLNNSAFLFTRL